MLHAKLLRMNPHVITANSIIHALFPSTYLSNHRYLKRFAFGDQDYCNVGAKAWREAQPPSCHSVLRSKLLTLPLLPCVPKVVLYNMAVSYKQVKKDINTLYGPEVDPKKGRQKDSADGSLGVKARLSEYRDHLFKRSNDRAEERKGARGRLPLAFLLGFRTG